MPERCNEVYVYSFMFFFCENMKSNCWWKDDFYLGPYFQMGVKHADFQYFYDNFQQMIIIVPKQCEMNSDSKFYEEWLILERSTSLFGWESVGRSTARPTFQSCWGTAWGKGPPTIGILDPWKFEFAESTLPKRSVGVSWISAKIVCEMMIPGPVQVFMWGTISFFLLN